MTELHERERWSSRVAFILASIGCSIGYGNVWRFPSLVAQYGGGAFFVPFFMALFIIGVPILILEIALGQAYQTGDMGAFGSMDKRLRGIGLTSVANSYFIVVYYAALLAWTLNAFFDTFVEPEAWTKGAADHFFNDIIGQSTLNEGSQMPTRFVPANVGYLALSWIIIFFCLVFGVKWEGRITYFTAGFPMIVLFVFLGLAMNLEGAQSGIDVYIRQWDMSVLTSQPDIWSTACTQVFFSIGVTFGTFTAFGSHCPRNAPTFVNSCIIATSDAVFAIIAGFFVYGFVGYVSVTTDTPISEISTGGMTLLFGVVPEALMTLPGGIHWLRLLFAFLFLLGIDSGFALTQSPQAVIHDTRYFRPTPRYKLVASLAGFGFFTGLIYVTDAGLLFLDVVDFYVNFIMILIGFFECWAAGWMFDLKKQTDVLGKPIVYLYMFSTFASVIVASILWFTVEGINNMAAGFASLIVIYGIGISGVVFLLIRKKREGDWTWKSILYQLLFSNIFELRDQLSAAGVGYLPGAWCVLIKHIIPSLLLILFINLAGAKTKTGLPLFGNYGSYVVWPYQFLGILTISLTLFFAALGWVRPSTYDIMADPEDGIKINDKMADEKQVDVPIDVPIDAPIDA